MTNGDYRHFYSVLKAKLKPYRDAKQHLDRFLSADFNVFKWIDPDENRRSDIIADLLNPSGSHGQQHRFLDAFLQAIKRPDLKAKKLLQVDCRVQTDYNRENPRGQMDILVEFEHFGLAIENKVGTYTYEQPRQLQRYHDHLKNKYGADQFCLVFLTPEGDKPTSIEDHLKEELMSENKLICISYNRDMLKWLAECCRLCESDKFRWFLRDFRDHMNGGQTMSIRNERDIILKHALEKEHLETALDINSAFNGKLNEEIIKGFLNKLENFVLDELRQGPDASEKWCVNNDDLRQNPLTQDKRFSFGKESWGDQHGVILAPASAKACNFAMGVWKNNDPKPIFNEEERLRETLTANFANIGKEPSQWNDKWWVWHCCLKAPYQHWNTKETLIKLHDEEAVRDLGSALVKIIRVIDEHVKGIQK